jgi:hypothetical protein
MMSIRVVGERSSGMRRIGLLLLLVLAAGCDKTAGAATSSTASLSASSVSSIATAPRLRPDPALTPGAAIAGVTLAQVCTSGYSASVRDVPESVRDQVFAEYGLTGANRSDFEVDHLISLELGGSNDITNLWPEPLHGSSSDGAVDKDRVENQLHAQMCAGAVSLPDAQQAIIHWDTTTLPTSTTTATTAVPVTTTTPPTTAVPVTTTAPPTTAPPATTAGVYYANCTAARAAGAAPIYRGDPGYRPALDRDDDGIACE